MYQIEKGVPVPKKEAKRKYPFREMAVGESFVTPLKERPNVLRAMTVENQRQDGKRYSSRTLADKSGVRIWRTE